ncbi:hypothetical protein TXIAM_240097 [Tenacibaculum xiamenense]
MLHQILTFIINFFIYTIIFCFWIALICAAFKIKPNLGWFTFISQKIIKPFLIKIWQVLLYFSKVFLKWFVFMLEHFWYFLIETLRKLFELIQDPKS